MSLEAGRIRSLVHKCRYHIMTRAVLDRANTLIAHMSSANATETAKVWKFHFHGSYTKISVHVINMIYCTMRGHEIPSLHIFKCDRLLTLSVLLGYILKPVLTSDRL
ncbi:hypothetical protein BC830DRAFT_723086 [Chytriomyces sp. MP71]|nr:hypothetical protein BC830DRAFT_723086 [Chytriomyces sp. MP71]